MKQYKSWKKLLVLTLILAFTLTASLQASEGVSEDTTGAEEGIIVEDTGVEEVTPAEDAAPEAEISSQDLVVSTITTVPTESVPLATNAGSNEEVSGQGEESQTSGKMVTFYLDWNGIDGLFGKCLTCTREYGEDGSKPKFTAEDAAVYGLNYTDKCEKLVENPTEGHIFEGGELDGKTPEEKWEILRKKWESETFNGYKFLGWSTQPTGGDLITSDTEIKDGMSFYAYWEKDGKSNGDFDRTDPEAGPLEAIRIIAGTGTQFRSGTLHASKHATANNSFTLNLFYTPVRATLKNVTWNVTVCKSVTLDDLSSLFRSAKNGETVRVKADSEETTVGETIHVKAEGCSLTITNMDGEEHMITVSATADGTDGTVFTAPSEATLSFTHSWDSGKVTEEPRCEVKGKVQYTCAECGETKTEDIPALQHVYNKNKDLNKDYTVSTEETPTCTKEGSNEYTFYCLREGCSGKHTETCKVPALGHVWEEDVSPVSCNKDMVTKYCTRDGCTARQVSLVPADNQNLHAWKETYRYNETCMSDIVYEQCAVCRKTRSRKEAADNPDRHSYVFESRVSVDCNHVIYTFRCVHGCGTAQVMLKKEENHNWGDWTTTTSWDKTTGTMKRIREHTCLRCGTKETENLDGMAEETEDPDGAVGETGNPGGTEGKTGDPDGTGKETGSPDSTGKETENPDGTVDETENSGDTVGEAGNSGDTEEKSTGSDGTEETESSENTAGKTDEPGDTTEETKVPDVTQAQTNSVAVSTNNAPVSQPMSYIAGDVAPVAVSPTALASADTEEKTVWQTVEKRKSYFSENSGKKAGWKKVGKKKYYFNENGKKKTGWKKINGKKYYFGKDGAMKTGWQTIKGKKYYFGKDGVMRTGKQKIGKKIYTFGKNGALK